GGELGGVPAGVGGFGGGGAALPGLGDSWYTQWQADQQASEDAAAAQRARMAALPGRSAPVQPGPNGAPWQGTAAAAAPSSGIGSGLGGLLGLAAGTVGAGGIGAIGAPRDGGFAGAGRMTPEQ